MRRSNICISLSLLLSVVVRVKFAGWGPTFLGLKVSFNGRLLAIVAGEAPTEAIVRPEWVGERESEVDMIDVTPSVLCASRCPS